MIASRAVFAFLCVVVPTAAGCGGGDANLPSAQQGLGEEITALGGNYFIDKKAPDQGMFSVDLSGTKADDAMVAKLSGLEGLKHLKLNAAPVTNASTASLMKMKNLLTLDIGNTKITAEALQTIRTALPTLEITWNAPDATPPVSAENNLPSN